MRRGLTRLVALLALTGTGAVTAYLIVHADRSRAAPKAAAVERSGRGPGASLPGAVPARAANTKRGHAAKVRRPAASRPPGGDHGSRSHHGRSVTLAGRPVPVPPGWGAVAQRYPDREHVSLTRPHGGRVLIDRTVGATSPLKRDYGYDTLRKVPFHDGRMHGTLWQFRASFCHRSCSDYLVFRRHSVILAAMATSDARVLRAVATRALLSLARPPRPRRQ